MSKFLPIQWINTNPYSDWPSFSLDGSQVVFTLGSARIAFAGNWGEDKQVRNQIWIVEPPHEPFRLEPGDPGACQGRSPNWSPTGERIVFESTRPTPDPNGDTWLAIWIINSDGKDPWQLTDRELFSAYHAEWSRQQTQVVFAGAGKGIGIITFE